MAKRTKPSTKNREIPHRGMREAPTEPTTRICIKNVPRSVEQMEQVKLFLFRSQESYFASTPLTITDCRILNKRRMAFVGFRTKSCAMACVRYLHNTYWKTSKIVVEYAVPPKATEKKTHSADSTPSNSIKSKELPSKEEDCMERKKRDVLDFIGASSSKGAFWSNDDGGVPVPETSNDKKNTDKANSGDGKNESSQSSADDNSDSEDSSEDNGEPLLESHQGMSDMDFLRAKTVRAEELSEELEPDTSADAKSPTRDTDGDGDVEIDEVVAMKTDPVQVEKGDEGEATDEVDAPVAIPETSSGRLFVRNLPFSVTEDDLSEYFSQFGALDECHVPVDDQQRSKGFGFVTFKDSDRAQHAREECDGTDFQGRIIQVLPARASRASQNSVNAPATYKERQELERQNLAGKDQTGWSASFVRGDAVVDNLAMRLGLKKGDVLGVKDGLSAGDAAVRMALGETAIIEENRKYFAEHGIDMEALVSMKEGKSLTESVERSKISILVKNLPADTTKDELLKCFGAAAVNPTRLLLPPSRTIAVVEYAHANEAKTAFRKLAYRRFKDVPLYLEWAPLEAKVSSEVMSQDEESKMDTGENLEETAAQDDLVKGALPTLYVKNLHFATTEDELREFFASVSGEVRAVRIPTKVAPAKRVAGKVLREEKAVSMGYGFVEFSSMDAAAKAMESVQGKMLAGHKLELQPTKHSGALTNGSHPKKKSSKLMVRNVPFQANRKELLTLFGSFGQIKKLRLPKKFDGNHRGFAFVDYISSKEAGEAMKALSRTHLYGRHLVIEWAEEDDEATGRLNIQGTSEPQPKRIRFT